MIRTLKVSLITLAVLGVGAVYPAQADDMKNKPQMKDGMKDTMKTGMKDGAKDGMKDTMKTGMKDGMKDKK